LPQEVVANPYIDWNNPRHAVLATKQRGDMDSNGQVIKEVRWSADGVEVEYMPENREAIELRDAQLRKAQEPDSLETLKARAEDLEIERNRADRKGDQAEVERIQGLLDEITDEILKDVTLRSGGQEIPVANTEIRGEDLQPGMRIGGKWHVEIPDPHSEDGIDAILEQDPSARFDGDMPDGTLAFPNTANAFRRSTAAQSFVSQPGVARKLHMLDNYVNSSLTPLVISNDHSRASINRQFGRLMDNDTAWGSEFSLDDVVDFDQFVGLTGAKLKRENGYVTLEMTRSDGSKVREYTKERLTDDSYYNWMHRALAYHGNGERPKWVTDKQLSSVRADIQSGAKPNGPAAIYYAHRGELIHADMMSRAGLTPNNNRYDGFLALRPVGDRDELAGATDLMPNGEVRVSISAQWLRTSGPARGVNSGQSVDDVILHENIHTLSTAIDDPAAIMPIIGFEEGLVESFRSHIRPDLADRMGGNAPHEDFWYKRSPYARWAHAFDNMARWAAESNVVNTEDEFYRKLLTMDVWERQKWLRTVARSLGKGFDRKQFDKSIDDVVSGSPTWGRWENIRSSGLD
jgi:hypothetical protein